MTGMLRDCSPALPDMLTTSHAVRVKVDSWRAGVLLAEDVPILSGTWSESADKAIAESVAITVPAMDQTGRAWAPKARGDGAALGSDGQRLRLSYIIPRADGSSAICPLGWVRIDDWELDGGVVSVAGSGLLSVIESYRLLTPTSPPAGSTLASEIVRLLEGLLPSSWTASGDRAAAQSMAWTEDRLGALYEIADATPAELRVNAAGVVVVSDAPAAWAEEIVLREGAGTVIRAGDGGSRDGVANIVVARGEDSGDPDRPPVYAIARNEDPLSPTNIRTFDPVVSFLASPLLTTAAAAQAAAATKLARSSGSATVVPVEILPDPRITVGTMATLIRADGRTSRTVVKSSVLQLTAAGGAQKVELSVWP